MTDLDSVIQYLIDNGPSKAKKIAKFLNIDRSELNSKLHSALKSKSIEGLNQNEKSEWEVNYASSIKIIFDHPAKWLEAIHIEKKLQECPDLFKTKNPIEFDFLDKSIFLDCILKVLSIINQLASIGLNITIKFNRNSQGFSYLQRCGFFDRISPKVTILPYRPSGSLATVYQANSGNLLEIFPITETYDSSILPRISALIKNKLSDEDSTIFLPKLRTLISELISNIRDHGLSEIEGYVSLQTYNNSGKIIIAISDSGSGLIHTIRNEALQYEYNNPDLQDFLEPNLTNDIKLLGHVFNKGRISRTGENRRGLGLSKSSKALKELSNNKVKTIRLSIRQQDNELVFPFNVEGVDTESCKPKKNLLNIMGTHYVLTIELDNLE